MEFLPVILMGAQHCSSYGVPLQVADHYHWDKDHGMYHARHVRKLVGTTPQSSNSALRQVTDHHHRMCSYSTYHCQKWVQLAKAQDGIAGIDRRQMGGLQNCEEQREEKPKDGSRTISRLSLSPLIFYYLIRHIL